jgi:Mrp family chromosome partitioning ATPase
MAVLLVTVAGPGGNRDLVLPADVPVGDLLAPVAAALADPRQAPPAAAATEPGAWRLWTAGGDLLPAERPLAASGVGDGARLVLGPHPPPDARAPAAPGGGAQLRRCAVVGVVSAAAGAGRTTVAALLASALAATRAGLTVAVDAHPGPGSPARPAHDHLTAGDLLALLEHPALTTGELVAALAPRGRRPALVTATAPAGGPMAPVAGGGHGHSRAPLDRRALTRLVHGLAAHAGALVLDCGPGLGDPGARVALATADQLVLVAEPEPSPDSRRVAGALADLGHAVVAVTTPPAGAAGARWAGARPGRRGGSGTFGPPVGGGTFGRWVGGGTLARWRGRGEGSWGAGPAARLLPGVRGVVPLPPRPAGAVATGPVPPTGGWDEVPPWWRRPAGQLADLLAADWPALGIATADPKPAGQAAQTGCRSRS